MSRSLPARAHRSFANRAATDRILIHLTADPSTAALIGEEGLPAPSPVPPGTPVYRGQPLSYYMRRYEQAAPEMRPAFLRQIGAFGEDATPAMKLLLNALSDQNPAVQQAACLALAQMGEKAAPAIPALAKRLSIGDASTTPQAAAMALREVGKASRTAVPELIEMLKDPSSTRRFMAVQVLEQVGDAATPAIPALIERLQVPKEETRIQRYAALVLGKLGPAAASALPALREARKTINVREEADAAILRLQGETPATWH